MPAQRKYATNAERQAAYRARRAIRERSRTPSPAPGYRRWNTMIRQARTLLETAAAEMGAYYEERSESWKDSERGDAFMERQESMEEIILLLGDLS